MGAMAHPLRILVVDDLADFTQSMAILLGLWGHDAIPLTDASLALETARKFLPHAALLDIAMPKLSGLELARRLRTIPGLEKIFLVAVSGYGREADVRKAFDAGFDHFLLKPVDLPEFQRVISSLARSLP